MSLLPAVSSCVERLHELFEKAESDEQELVKLDTQVMEVVREFGKTSLSNMLSDLGCRGSGTSREVGIDTALGHVRFNCKYVPPVELTRKERRRKKRDAAKKARRKGETIRRKDSNVQSAYPFRDKLQLTEGMTQGLSRLHNHITVICGSFREGCETMQLLLGVRMSESTFMRRSYDAGVRALFEQERVMMRMILQGKLPSHLISSLIETIPTLYIMLDGTGVPCVKRDTRKRKGKNGGHAKTREIKVGVLGTYRYINSKGNPVRDPGAETYIASAKTAREFGSILRRVANSRGLGQKTWRIVICGDGAEWIEKIVQQSFPLSGVIFVNDFYHACEHLNRFLSHSDLKGKTLEKAYKKARGILLRNGGKGLIVHMQRYYAEIIKTNKDAAGEYTYFEKRVNNMKYPEYRKSGLYIGSGIVEAACRTVVARRCKQAGQFWRLQNAEAMCALVAKHRSAKTINYSIKKTVEQKVA